MLALFFVADDEVAWREDAGGRVTLENAGRSLMVVDGARGTVHFLSLFERRVVPVDPARAEKIIALMNFFLGRRLAKGDELGFDYPLRGKVYHVRARATAVGQVKLTTFPARTFAGVHVEGDVTGWAGNKAATINAYVGREGELAGKLLKVSFKFADWPRVTMTLSGYEVN